MREDSITVLVTGVGAIIGHGIIKSLRQSAYGIRIIGLDRNPKAFGAAFCDKFVVKPAGHEGQAYIDFLLGIIAQEHIDLIIPGIEDDVFFFYENRDVDWNTAIVMNSRAAMECGKDKLLLHTVLEENHFLAIPTVVSNEWHECACRLGEAPYLLKPCRGSGSRGHAILHDENDFSYWTRKSAGNYLIQKIVGNAEHEYTVAIFGYGDGSSSEPAIFKRKLAPSGATGVAETVLLDEQILAAVHKLNAVFIPIGPTNYQFRKENESVYLLEINPRISASTSLRAALGFNEAHMCIEYFCLKKIPAAQRMKLAFCQRYLDDIVTFL